MHRSKLVLNLWLKLLTGVVKPMCGQCWWSMCMAVVCALACSWWGSHTVDTKCMQCSRLCSARYNGFSAGHCMQPLLTTMQTGGFCSSRDNDASLILAQQFLGFEEVGERRAACHSTPDNDIGSCHVVQHPGRLIGISRRDSNIEHTACTGHSHFVKAYAGQVCQRVAQCHSNAAVLKLRFQQMVETDQAGQGRAGQGKAEGQGRWPETGRRQIWAEADLRD